MMMTLRMKSAHGAAVLAKVCGMDQLARSATALVLSLLKKMRMIAMTKEELLQDWLPRLFDALQQVRNNENAAAQEAIYELYVEMKQQTLSEKMSTFSEITLEDQMSAMAIELQSAQKRLANLELGICQRAFESNNGVAS
jgi:hypothetical protein